MYSQNILNYYGSKLDLALDSSQLYDFEIAKTENDFDNELLDLTSEITYTSLVIDSSCVTSGLNTIKPWVIEIAEPYTGETCDFTVRKRTEKGWTLNFVFNRESNPWISGNTFYYWGISGETDPLNYLDNNLSFSFTSDGRIMWEALHYSGYCGESGFTGTSVTYSGQTPVLCTGGTSDDFEITITFKRYREYDDCDLLNEGGSNDLITGWTVTNAFDVLTGATEEFTLTEMLNQRWWYERQKRLGVLKIYLNGKRVYKLSGWEEIIPSTRTSGNTIVQVWGGGTTESGGIHEGTTGFNLKEIKYYEEPLDFLHIRHNYLVITQNMYNITECANNECVDNVASL
jgi:hypothetical protein